MDPRLMSRRAWFQRTGAGFGGLALASFLAPGSRAGESALAAPHFRPSAKRVIWLFMGGGPSHIDTFDPKPEVTKRSGEKIPVKLPAHLRDSSTTLLGSPFEFKQHGGSGIPVSELLPHMAEVVDDLTVIRSMQCGSIDHTGATLPAWFPCRVLA
jgi:hypothetical protein